MKNRVFQAQRGFLTIAQNTDIDYLNLAYLQAMSIKITMPQSLYAVLVDRETYKYITSKHKKVFDYIITIDNDNSKNESWKLSNEWQAYYLSPFKETIKLESDIIFTRDIYHWWNAFRLRDIVLSLNCQNYLQEQVIDTKYRQVFVENNLPNIYNGLMYFRYSQTSEQFFNYARIVFENWTEIQDTVLKKSYDINPTTDVVYAIVANILGPEQCTIPELDWINFVHMKPAINNWPNKPWTELVNFELDLPMIRINNINQYHPLHYHVKDWASIDVIKEYEKCLNIS